MPLLFEGLRGERTRAFSRHPNPAAKTASALSVFGPQPPKLAAYFVAPELVVQRQLG